MSEVVVRMEMPTNCWGCPNGQPDWIYSDDGALKLVCFCNICNTKEDNKWISETETERPSWCPIIGELPEHGDLIDRDHFKENLDMVCDAGGWLEPVTQSVRVYCKKQVDCERAIVPATERSET